MKVRTEPQDPYTKVIARHGLDLRVFQYGELGCGPYVLVSEIREALKKAERTDTDRIDTLERLKFEIQYLRDCKGWFVVNASGEEVFAGDTIFRTWREAADAVCDLDEL